MNIRTLNKLNEKIKVKNIIAFDVETYQNEKKQNIFYLGTTYDENGSQTFLDKESMIQYLLIQRRNTLIVASNLEFDFNILFFDTPLFFKFKPIINGSNLVAMIYNYNNTDGSHSIKFIDSYNYMKASVEKYGKIIGVNKLDKPTYLGRIPSHTHKATVYIGSDIDDKIQVKELDISEYDYLIIYCQRDSEVTYKFMQYLQNGFNLIGANLKLTVASTSMNLYRRVYQPCSIKSEERKHDNITNKIFKGYFGGRTEIFKRGFVKNMNYLDYNSMYPSVMLNEYPFPDSIKYASFPTRDVLEYEGVAFVLMECSKEVNIPLLPVMDKKLLFATGIIKGIYTHIEIREAIEQYGYVVKQIYWSAYYTKTFYPFKEYILDMYHKRQEYKQAKDNIEILYKLMMNSLYGKFAQKDMTEIEMIDYNDEDTKKEIIKRHPKGKYTINQNSKGYVTDKTQCTSNFVRPIFSVYTTAMSRIKITRDIVKYDGCYCDTDSIITRKEISDSNKLGELKKELFIKRGILIKPKMYHLITQNNEEIIRLKGVPKISAESFEQILYGKKTQYMKFSKMKESIKGNYTPMTVNQMIKSINLEDDKRKWTTRFNPLFLDEYSTPYEITRYMK